MLEEREENRKKSRNKIGIKLEKVGILLEKVGRKVGIKLEKVGILLEKVGIKRKERSALPTSLP